MPPCAAVHFLECLRQDSDIATRLDSLAISARFFYPVFRHEKVELMCLVIMSLLSMRNIKTLLFIPEPAGHNACQGDGKACNLSNGHWRALSIDTVFKEEKGLFAAAAKPPLSAFKFAFRFVFNSVQQAGYLPDYGMTNDFRLVLPRFDWEFVVRETATRYRSGPYGTSRKK
jgi:hypothetical protein